MCLVIWDVEVTDEFIHWWTTLEEDQQDAVAASVRLLEGMGTTLGFPHSSGVKTSRHSHMRELRVQHRGRPLRVFYAFDLRRTAILLIGGAKSGDDRFYKTVVRRADSLYDEHLALLQKEGLI